MMIIRKQNNDECEKKIFCKEALGESFSLLKIQKISQPGNKISLFVFLLFLLCNFFSIAGDFSPVEKIEITSSPAGMKYLDAGDIDHDGDEDIVAVRSNGTTGTMYWYENVSGFNNTMVQKTIDNSVTIDSRVFVIDLDKNNKMDVVILAGYGTYNSIHYYRNLDGVGTSWDMSVIVSNVKEVIDICFDDMDQDGDIDFVTAGMSDIEMNWYENTAGNALSWTAHTVVDDLSTGGFTSFSVADINNDGRKDVISTYYRNILWFENTGGSFLSHTVATDTSTDYFYDICVRDMDNDGMADICANNFVKKEWRWWKNSSNGASWAIQYGLTNKQMSKTIVADLDLDGDMDLLGMGTGTKPFYYYENLEGTGSSWSLQSFEPVIYANDFIIKDPDKDGDPDILFACAEPLFTSLGWMKNTTPHNSLKFTPQSEIFTDLNPSALSSAYDLDRNGTKDIVAASSADNSLYLIKSEKVKASADLTWSKTLIANTASGAASVYLADLDKNYSPDIICAAKTGNAVYWYENNLPGTWTERAVATNAFNTTAAIAADVDKDGDNDVIYCRTTTAGGTGYYIYWAENDGTPDTVTTGDWSQHIIDNDADEGPVSINSGDFDKDHDIDLVATFQSEGKVKLFRDDSYPDPAFSTITIDSALAGAKSVCMGDLDKDGTLDIIACGSKSDISGTVGKVVWYKYNPADPYKWTKHIVSDNLIGTNHVSAADIDNDGDIDIQATFSGSTKSSSSGVCTFINDGSTSPTFAKTTIISKVNFGNYPSPFYGVCADDFDLNGKTDLVTGNSGSKTFFIPNNGGQYTMTYSNVASGTINQSVRAPIFKFTIKNNGFGDDSTLYFRKSELLFEETAGDPLTTTELQNLISNISIHKDDGSGVFEYANDTLVVSTTNLTLTNGIMEVLLPSTLTDFHVSPGETKTYFLVVLTKSNAGFQTPHQFILTNTYNDEYPVCRNLDSTIELIKEYSTSTSTPVLNIGSTVSAETIADVILKKVIVIITQVDKNGDGIVDIRDVILRVNQD